MTSHAPPRAPPGLRVPREAFRAIPVPPEVLRTMRPWHEGHSMRCANGARSTACVARALAIHGAVREISTFPKNTLKNACRKRQIGPPCTKMQLFQGHRHLRPWKSCKTLQHDAPQAHSEPNFERFFGKVEKPCNGQDIRRGHGESPQPRAALSIPLDAVVARRALRAFGLAPDAFHAMRA